MSMNLHCEGLRLRQTTTEETDRILSWDKWGQPQGGWEGVADRYIAWLMERRAKCAKPPTRWYTDPVWEEYTQEIDEISQAVAQAKRENRKLQFYRI